MGIPVEKFKGIPAVFEEHYGRLRASALSIAGVNPMPTIRLQTVADYCQCGDIVESHVLFHGIVQMNCVSHDGTTPVV